MTGALMGVSQAITPSAQNCFSSFDGKLYFVQIYLIVTFVPAAINSVIQIYINVKGGESEK